MQTTRKEMYCNTSAIGNKIMLLSAATHLLYDIQPFSMQRLQQNSG